MLDALGKALNSAIDAAQDVIVSTVNDTADIAKSAVNDGVKLAEDFASVDVFERVSDAFSFDGIVDGVKDLISFDTSLGGLANRGLDALGLPDWVGDVAGVVVDLSTFNYGGAAVNGLDALQDVATACGQDEIAGYLGVAQDVTSMFCKVGSQVALTMATGGAGASGLLSQAGQLGQLGQFAEVAMTAGKVLEHVDTALDVVDSFQKGDYLGAGMGVFNAFGGNFDVVGDLLGDALSPEVRDLIGDCFGAGEKIFDAIGSNSAIEGLLKLPFAEVGQALGLDLGDFAPMLKPAMDLLGIFQGNPATEMLGSLLENAGFPSSLMDAIGEIVGQQLPDPSNMMMTVLGQAFDHSGDLLKGMLDVAGMDPAVADILVDLLGEAASMATEVELATIHCGNLRV